MSGSNNGYERHISGIGSAYEQVELSGLPGIHNGPADAYRHIIGAAEATRIYGETIARKAIGLPSLRKGCSFDLRARPL